MKSWKSLSVKAAIAVASIVAAPAMAQAQTAFRSVSVDTAAIAARDGSPLARDLAVALTQELRRSFADRLHGGKAAPRLVVRISRLRMGVEPEGRSTPSGVGGSSTDYLKGEALIVGANGRILASHPMMSTLQANYAGPWYLPGAERKRVAAIAWQYAAWLRRELADI